MKYDPTITDAQVKELRWLSVHNGSGVVDRYGRLLAGGELRASCYNGSWLRLVTHGYLGGTDGRLVVTDKGRQYLEVLGE